MDYNATASFFRLVPNPSQIQASVLPIAAPEMPPPQ